MSAEGGPSGGGIGASGFSAGGEGMGDSSIGAVGTISSGGAEMGSISSGASFAVSTSESSSFSPGPQLSSGSEHSLSNFAEFESITSDPSAVSFDTPFHGDLSFLNPSIDLSPKSLATVNNTSTLPLSESDSFVTGLLADLADDSEATFHSESLADPNTDNESVAALLDTFSIDEIALLDTANSTLNQPEALTSTEIMSVTDSEIASENDLSNAELSQNSTEDSQINSIRAELEALIDPASHTKTTESLEVDSVTPVTDETLLGEVTDLTSSLVSDTLNEKTTEHTQPEEVTLEQEENFAETDSEATTELETNKDKVHIASLLKGNRVNVSEQELNKGVTIVEQMQEINIAEEKAIKTIAQVLAEPTYALEEVGEEGKEQIIIEKIAQDINTEMPKPVVHTEVNEARRELGIKAVENTIDDIQKFLLNEKELEVAKKDIWVSGQDIAEVIKQNAPISGILEKDPDGSKNGLANDIANEWMTIYTAPGKIAKAIRDNNAIEVSLSGELASEDEVTKVLSGGNTTLIYARPIK